MLAYEGTNNTDCYLVDHFATPGLVMCIRHENWWDLFLLWKCCGQACIGLLFLFISRFCYTQCSLDKVFLFAPTSDPWPSSRCCIVVCMVDFGCECLILDLILGVSACFNFFF